MEQDFAILNSIRPLRGCPKTPKVRRASRAETLILQRFPSFLPQKGGPKTLKIRRASRAETLIQAWVFKGVGQKGVKLSEDQVKC